MRSTASQVVLGATGAGVVGTGAAVLGYASLVERQAYRVRRVTVPVLPPGAAPLRVLHVSDVHITPAQTRKRAWVARLARFAPDLVVATGDNLAHADAVPALLEAFAPLLTVPGVFVLASNDYYAPVPKNPLKYFNPRHKRVHGDELPWREMAKAFTDAGWHDMSNARARLRVGGLEVEVRGLDDPHHKLEQPALVAGPPSPGVDLSLGLVHAPEPRVVDLLVADGVQITFCGHTHGGQLRIPGYGALVTNCGIDRARCRGLSRYAAGGRDAWLHVSAGLGTSPYAPVRFACPPEVTLLTLTSGRADL